MARKSAFHFRASQKKRYKRAGAKALFFVFLFVALIGGLAWGSHYKKLQLVEVEIGGAKVIRNADIKAVALEAVQGNYFYLFSKANSFIYPREGIKAHILKEFPRLQYVALETQGLDTLRVDVVEREPYALWCQKREVEECWFMDEGGYIFDIAPSFSGDAYTRFYSVLDRDTIAGPFADQETFSYVKEITSILHSFNFEVVSFSFLDGRDIRVETKEGAFLIDSEDEKKAVLENLKAVLASDVFEGESDQEIDYIDLRFGNKVYYKLK